MRYSFGTRLARITTSRALLRCRQDEALPSTGPVAGSPRPGLEPGTHGLGEVGSQKREEQRAEAASSLVRSTTMILMSSGRDSDFRVFGVWTPTDIFLIAAGSAGALGLLLWLRSVEAWWADPVGTYLVMLILAGGGVGAYGGWALDNVDDRRQSRKIVAQLVALALGVPLIILFGRQALGVPFDASPGRWPRIFDAVARFSISGLPATAAVAVVWLLARKARSEGLVCVAGSAFVIALLLLSAWPWVPSRVPLLARGALLGGLLLVAVVAAKRLKPPPPTAGKT